MINEAITSYGGYERKPSKRHRRDTGNMPRELPIGDENDYNFAKDIAHAYAKDFAGVKNPKSIFEQLGNIIGKNYQFLDKGAGCNTIGGQLRLFNNVDRHDCKLPSFLFTVACKELKISNVEIIFKHNNTAHPIIHAVINEEDIFGHFVKPRPNDSVPRSGFEIFNRALAEKYVKYINDGELIAIKPDLNGMKKIDEAFVSGAKRPLLDITK